MSSPPQESAAGSTDATSEDVSFARPKKFQPKGLRGKKRDSESANDDSSSSKLSSGPAHGSTKSAKATETAAENEEGESAVVRKNKERKTEGPNWSSTSSRKVLPEERLVHSYDSRRSAMAVLSTQADAIRTLEIEAPEATDNDKLKKLAEADKAEGKQLYRGMGAYTDYRANLKREGTGKAKGTGIQSGPVRAASNIRLSCRFDYQPDICKDWKETGYCGYGDSCKFVHDRSDYKSGWQLEKEWDAEQKRKLSGIEDAEPGEDGKGEFYVGGDDSDGDNDDDGLPFACLICKVKWAELDPVPPVVTRCGHYFCERCAFQHEKSAKACYTCNAATGGIFNVPHKLNAKLARLKKVAEADQKDDKQESD